jgi:hypothetical protein
VVCRLAVGWAQLRAPLVALARGTALLPSHVCGPPSAAGLSAFTRRPTVGRGVLLRACGWSPLLTTACVHFTLKPSIGRLPGPQPWPSAPSLAWPAWHCSLPLPCRRGLLLAALMRACRGRWLLLELLGCCCWLAAVGWCASGRVVWLRAGGWCLCPSFPLALVAVGCRRPAAARGAANVSTARSALPFVPRTPIPFLFPCCTFCCPMFGMSHLLLPSAFAPALGPDASPFVPALPAPFLPLGVCVPHLRCLLSCLLGGA